MLQLVEPGQELLKGGPLALVRMHTDVCQLLQKKKTYTAAGSGYGSMLLDYKPGWRASPYSSYRF